MSKNKLNNYYWPLNVPTFTFFDKYKVFRWLLKEPQWTAGKWVRKYEEKWEKYLDNKSHAIAVSSGSTANELIALRRKWELEKQGRWPRDNKVIFASNTWISNCSVWINLGFEPVFVDPKLTNLCVAGADIEKELEKDPTIGTVFYTSLLGYADSYEALIRVKYLYANVKFMMDNCESSFSEFSIDLGMEREKLNFNNFSTSSTSCFFSHFTTSGTELGLIFTQDKEEMEWYRMNRNHGLTRGMPEEYKNLNVDSMFDFYYMGSNYRTSNLACYMALLDFDRALEFSKRGRRLLSYRFYAELDYDLFEHPHYGSQIEEGYGQIPLAIPIIVKESANRPDLIHKLKGYLSAKGVETRPIIGGFLGFQTAFKKYNLDPEQYKRSVYLHKNGIYIGLHQGIDVEMAKVLAQEISKL